MKRFEIGYAKDDGFGRHNWGDAFLVEAVSLFHACERGLAALASMQARGEVDPEFRIVFVGEQEGPYHKPDARESKSDFRVTLDGERKGGIQ